MSPTENKLKPLYKPQTNYWVVLVLEGHWQVPLYSVICSAWGWFQWHLAETEMCGSFQFWESSCRTEYYCMPFSGGNGFGTLVGSRNHLNGCWQGGLCCLAVRIFFFDINLLTMFSSPLTSLFISHCVTQQFCFVPLKTVATGCVSKKAKLYIDLFCPEYHL